MSRAQQGDAVTIPRGMQIATAWSWRLLLVGGAIYLMIRILAIFLVLVAPVVIALLLVALIRPLTDVLERARMARSLAALLTLLAFLLVIGGLGALIGTQVANGFPQLLDQAQAGIGEVREWLAGPPLHLTTDQLAGYLDQVRQSVAGSQGQVFNGALAATATVGHVIAGIFITLFSTYFFLAQGSAIWRWLLGLFPAGARQPLDIAAGRGWVSLTSFVRATVVVALVDALGIGIGAAVLGVPLALPLGALVFFGAFIPIVGAFVSGSVAVLIALVAVGTFKAILMLAVVLAVQQLESHGLQPFLMGRAVRVHPLAVILGLAAGALIGGILGALFAVPLMAAGNTMVLSLAGRSAQDENLAAAQAGGEITLADDVTPSWAGDVSSDDGPPRPDPPPSHGTSDRPVDNDGPPMR